MRGLSLCNELKKKAVDLVLILALLATPLVGSAQNASFLDSVADFSSESQPEQIIQDINLSNVHFVKAPGNRINFGLVGNEYNYVLLKISSAISNNEQYLSMTNTSLDSVTIYRVDLINSTQRIYLGGQLVPFNRNNKYVWHIARVANNAVPLFYLIAIKANQKNINLQYELLSRGQLEQKYRAEDRIIFFYIGVVCLIIIITLLALLLFQKQVFAAYLGYIVFAFTWILSHYGYVFPYLYPQFPLINEIAKPVSSLGASFFLLMVLNLLFRQQLQGRSQLQQLIKTTLRILPFLIVSMMLLLIPGLGDGIRFGLMVLWHMGLVFTICLIVTVPFSFIHSGATPKLFASAMLVICIMSVVQLFANAGTINSNFIEEHGITVGSLLENITIAFGLFYNLLQERKQREMQVLALKQEQAETLKNLVAVQDNERKRIAGDLHDYIGPLLAALKINFRRIVDAKEGEHQSGLVGKTESIIDDSIAEIRNVALNLMPKGLSKNGLISSLQEYFDSLQQLYDKTISFRHEVTIVPDHQMQINLYRIICELTLNAARHSDAVKIMVTIEADEKSIKLTISDDGKGFQLKQGDNRVCLGLQNAESRVTYLKGKFDLKSEAGKGTRIGIEIPLQLNQIKVNGF